jgi:hypothetical protein
VEAIIVYALLAISLHPYSLNEYGGGEASIMMVYEDHYDCFEEKNRITRKYNREYYDEMSGQEVLRFDNLLFYCHPLAYDPVNESFVEYLSFDGDTLNGFPAEEILNNSLRN